MMSKVTRRSITALGALLAFSAVLPYLAPQDPLAVDLSQRLLPPDSTHWFGTDELGRDLLSRIQHGLSLTLWLSIAALATAFAVGSLVGAVAGYWRGRWPDRALSWLTDVMTSIPFLLVIAGVLAVVGPGLGKAYAVLAGVMWVHPARIVQMEVARAMSDGYVAAARAGGVPEWRILLLSVLPGCLDAAALFLIAYLPEIIALEAGLSFLGLGVQPPQPGIGKMIFDGVSYLSAAWWMAVFPAAALFVVVLIVRVILVFTRQGKEPWFGDGRIDRALEQEGTSETRAVVTRRSP